MRYVTKTRPVSVMDQIFDSMFYDNTAAVKSSFRTFPVDIIEEGDQYLVTAELPGYTDSDVEITLNDNLLVITASKIKVAEKSEKKEETNPEQSLTYLLKERNAGDYKRSFSLPKDANREAIKATLKEGVLNLSIDKKPEAKPLSIKIN